MSPTERRIIIVPDASVEDVEGFYRDLADIGRLLDECAFLQHEIDRLEAGKPLVEVTETDK
jgi:hypothetical protein